MNRQHGRGSESLCYRWLCQGDRPKRKVSLAYSKFLGYDKGENGTLKINPQQAPIVRRIYDMFLEGMTTKSIVTQLSCEGIPKASSMTIKSILTNEKYTGNAILQKTFKTDLLSERRINRRGQAVFNGGAGLPGKSLWAHTC